MREKVEKAVYEAIDEINRMLPDENNLLEKSPSEVITGEGAKLDSLGYVNFLVAIEERLEEFPGISFSLSERASQSTDNVDLSTVGRIIDVVLGMMGDKGKPS